MCCQRKQMASVEKQGLENQRDDRDHRPPSLRFICLQLHVPDDLPAKHYPAVNTTLCDGRTEITTSHPACGCIRNAKFHSSQVFCVSEEDISKFAKSLRFRTFSKGAK